MSGKSAHLQWRKSSYSGPDGNCVEVASTPDGGIAIRDSKDPHLILTTTSRDWEAFLKGAHDGEFDDMV